MMFQRGEHLQSYPVEWALLQVTQGPDGGVCTCRLYSRFRDPLRSAPGIAGYRCLKLGTTRAALRFQLVDEKTRRPIASQPITVSDDYACRTSEAYSTNYDGLMQTKQKYDHLAFVRVLNQDGSALAQVPVPILDERAVVCPMTIAAQAQDLGDLQLQKQFVMAQVSDGLTAANQLFKQLGDLVKDKDHKAARDKAEAGRKALENDLARYDSDLAALSTRAGKLGLQDQLKLTQEEQLILNALKARPRELLDVIHNLDKVIQEEPVMRKLLGMVEQARLLEKQADYEQALELYRTVLKELKEGGDKPKLQAHFDKLNAEWQIKSEEHRQAQVHLSDLAHAGNCSGATGQPRQGSRGGQGVQSGRRPPDAAQAAAHQHVAENASRKGAGRAQVAVGRGRQQEAQDHRRGE